MNLTNFIQRIFGKRNSVTKAPFVIINKDSEVMEYDSIEAVIIELEKDPDIHLHKIEKIRASFKEMTIVKEVKPAGRYTVKFDCSNLGSGVYFYKITSGNFSAIKRMVLMK